MATFFSTPALHCLQPEAAPGSPATGAVAAGFTAARYVMPRRGSSLVLCSALVSAAAHAVMFFGVHPPARPAVRNGTPQAPVIALALPQLKELEEPELARAEKVTGKPEVGAPAPLLADLPKIPVPGDFVQPMDFSSLIETADFAHLRTFTIPEHINRTGKSGSTGVAVFDLSDLDRIPEVVFQPHPLFPESQKRYVSHATVRTEFVVDAEGKVGDIRIVESSRSGFEDATRVAIQRWRFRPGLKDGRKVNCLVSVPVIFRLVAN